jgi:16S rRNA pseudouridine516 synthase
MAITVKSSAYPKAIHTLNCFFMRLDKYICKSTDLSTQHARELIQSGHAKINDAICIYEARQVHEGDTVKLQENVLTLRPFRYLMLHKPAGYICSNKDERHPSLLNLINIENSNVLNIVGRLDVDTTGLVLLSDDGRWTYNVSHPGLECSKLYRVGLSKPIEHDAIQTFKDGVRLKGSNQLTRPAELTILKDKDVRLSITEGKNHQVKRMFRAVGNRVDTLHREQIGSVRLDIPEGQWRHLTEEEVLSFSTRS